jgi:hypothetical protein
MRKKTLHRLHEECSRGGGGSRLAGFTRLPLHSLYSGGVRPAASGPLVMEPIAGRCAALAFALG